MNRIALLIITLLVGWTSAAAAGPWARRRGGGYAKLDFRWLPGLGYSNSSGSKVGTPTFHEFVISLYAEVGIYHRVTLTVNAPLVQLLAIRNPRTDSLSTHVHTGDPTFGLRLQLLEWRRFALSMEAGFTAPIAPSTPVTDVFSTADGHPLIGGLMMGAGVWNAHWGLSFGYSWTRIYTAFSARYVYRSGGFDHQLQWSAEWGLRVGPWAVRGRIRGLHPLNTGSAPPTNSLNGVGNGAAFVGGSLEGEYHFTRHLAIGLNVQGSLGYARRQERGPVISSYISATW